MRWTYYIDEGHQVFPKNTRNSDIEEALDDSQTYAYRRTPPDNLELVGVDYDYVKTLEATRLFEKFTFEMHDGGVKHAEGEFTINDIEFDDYKFECKIKITAKDIYTAIQQNEDIEVNIVADREEVTIERYSYWHFFLTQTTGSTGSDDIPNGYQLIASRNISLFGIYVNLFVTELIQVDENYGVPTGWISTPYADLGDYVIYKRFPVDFPTLNYVTDIYGTTDLSDYQWSGQLLDYHVPFDESLFNLYKVGPDVRGKSIDATNFWLKKTVYNGRANEVFDQIYSGMDLKDSLNRILTVACPDFTGTVKSSLLFEDVPETGKTLPTGYPQSLTSKSLIEMSDFRRPNASGQATKGIITLKQAIEYLCQKFYARWCIDADGNLRIEHITYYKEVETGADISNLDTTRKYGYLQNSKPNREYMSESSGWNEDFAKIEVLYGTVPALNGMKENTKTISLSTIYTDIDGLNSHISEISDDGFVLVESILFVVAKGTGFKSGGTGIQNANLSNANCLNDYYRYDAYQQSYQIGGKDVDAISIKSMKTQDIIFKMDTIPDCTKKIITRLGAGIITSLSYKPTEENNFKATILYE